jgi:hypothetical protein
MYVRASRLDVLDDDGVDEVEEKQAAVLVDHALRVVEAHEHLVHDDRQVGQELVRHLERELGQEDERQVAARGGRVGHDVGHDRREGRREAVGTNRRRRGVGRLLAVGLGRRLERRQPRHERVDRHRGLLPPEPNDHLLRQREESRVSLHATSSHRGEF